MNIVELKIISNAANEIDRMVNELMTLYNHTGSMGETQTIMSAIIRDGDGKQIFSGVPDCVGYETKSNYAYEETQKKDPSDTIFSWAKEKFPQAWKMELGYSSLKDWEGSAVESKDIKAIFHMYYAAGMVSDFVVKETTQTNDVIITDIIMGGENCTFERQYKYPNEHPSEETDCDNAMSI